MTADALYLTLHEANYDSWESVQQAMSLAQGQVPPRVAWLLEHIHDTKRGYWAVISGALGTSRPPDHLGLSALMAWELTQLAALSAEQRQVTLAYGGRLLDVAALIRLNARHAVWHAGQIAALAARRTA
ncbi:hypothetical protein [Deinococcus peraridilitoris]|uniref:DinB-like domain-containing protein n=1 Tax=Deinococcus peraridilitoris (strain DSM 19664 / LMG 22246 / CIP 109416 / KR-200) TaxID=937777 RepID=K9ZW17_DEIPD|nr:hypothetical protein [Deinococcus peraridilitoris]AFZ65833.1 hypothetical protein Deipe_0231 [Deinococcus peraridilitoris DSM 19664]